MGLKRLSQAIKKLKQMLNKEEDPLILIEIINALKNIGNSEAEEILKIAKEKLKEHSLVSKYL